MKALRAVTIILVFFLALILFISLGVVIGMAVSKSVFPLGEMLLGFVAGLLIGTPLAMVVGNLFGKYVWPMEKKPDDSGKDRTEGQQVSESEMRNREIEEKQRAGP